MLWPFLFPFSFFSQYFFNAEHFAFNSNSNLGSSMPNQPGKKCTAMENCCSVKIYKSTHIQNWLEWSETGYIYSNHMENFFSSGQNLIQNFSLYSIRDSRVQGLKLNASITYIRIWPASHTRIVQKRFFVVFG